MPPYSHTHTLRRRGGLSGIDLRKLRIEGGGNQPCERRDEAEEREEERSEGGESEGQE